MAYHEDMRTTLTLDADVAERLRQEMKLQGRGLKAVVNEALRRGLNLAGSEGCSEPFQVEPHDFRFNPGLDLDRMNQLADELEAQEAGLKLRT